MNRRNFLKLMLFLPSLSFAKKVKRSKNLKLYNLHTKEKLIVKDTSKESLQKVSHFLRDYRTNEVIDIDKELVELLFELYHKTSKFGYMSVISGYRSPTTNEYLRKHTDGVSKNSMHTKGKAVDIFLGSEKKVKQFAKEAKKLRKGGVGEYYTHKFVHIDTGRVRHWNDKKA